MECKICKKDFSGGICPRCKYEHIVVLNGGPEPETEKNRELEHKKLVSKVITDISIIGKHGENNKEKGLVFNEKPVYSKIADGDECFNKIVWGKQEYCMHPEDEWKKEYLEISYKVSGKKVTDKTLVMPIQSGYYWQVGVKLNDDFTMEFYLGHSEKYEVSDKVIVKLDDLEM